MAMGGLGHQSHSPSHVAASHIGEEVVSPVVGVEAAERVVEQARVLSGTQPM